MQTSAFQFLLDSQGLIRITGPDAEKFLQGQLTCDVREVKQSLSRLGAHCDHKGRVQATFRLFTDAENFYMQLPRSVIPHLMQCLQKYAIFSKVTLTDVSDQWQQIGICGEIAVLEDYLKFSLSNETDQVVIANNIFILKIPGINRFCLLTSNTLSINSLPQQPESAWQLLDIEAGIPTIFPETIGLFTPQQINFPAINGVSFTKGCYTGQEIVARMHYLGKTKQRMYRISFTSSQPPVPGTALMNQQEVGNVVQAITTGENEFQGLAVIFDSALSGPIYLNTQENVILNILDLPYLI